MTADGADMESDLRQRVREAHRAREPLRIAGGASKDFYGRAVEGAPLDISAHRGVLRYDPAELVLSARAGTRIDEIEALLGEHRQMLGFEPPRFSGGATIGGALSAGLAGPRRPYAGAARDFVLGVKILSGKGEVMRFGGEVIKNVAGFDLARLMTGALGTLGVLLEVSLRVIPRPQAERTLLLEQPNAAEAVACFNRLAARPLPLSAAAWHDGAARIRLSASEAGVAHAAAAIGGETDNSAGENFWRQLRDHELPFFTERRKLWRLALPPAAELPACAARAPQWIDWGGAQRWLAGDLDRDALCAAAAERGGHVTCFRHFDPRGEVFQPLAPAARALHLRLKRAFDPAGILNPGRLYAGV